MLKTKKLIWAIRIWILRKLKPQATHAFFYSKRQNTYYPGNTARFKGRLYSEMRYFDFGCHSSWSDARLLGIGTISDVDAEPYFKSTPKQNPIVKLWNKVKFNNDPIANVVLIVSAIAYILISIYALLIHFKIL